MVGCCVRTGPCDTSLIEEDCTGTATYSDCGATFIQTSIITPCSTQACPSPSDCKGDEDEFPWTIVIIIGSAVIALLIVFFAIYFCRRNRMAK